MKTKTKNKIADSTSELVLKQLALMQYLGESYVINSDGIPCLEDGSEVDEFVETDYLVYSDYEADEAFEENIRNYIDDCVLPEIPEQYRSYFDEEKFALECEIDGRGHCLASYDGIENKEEVNGETFYIYKIN